MVDIVLESILEFQNEQTLVLIRDNEQKSLLIWKKCLLIFPRVEVFANLK